MSANNVVLDTFHLFAGGGGGILSDLILGHRPIGAIEIEAYPRKVLLARQLDGSLPGFPIWDDVRTFRADNPDTKPYIDRLRKRRSNLAICGGFPCQDISSAGAGAGIEGSKSSMWKHMARIIDEIRPRYAFVENSPLLVGRGAALVIGDLAEMGYDSQWCIVSASDCGAPHQRERFWLLAHSNEQGPQRGIFGDEPGIETALASSGRGEEISNAEKSRQYWTKPAINTCANGCPPEPSKIGKWPWPNEPELPRVANGISARVAKLRTIGNAQVPRVAATAFRILSGQ